MLSRNNFCVLFLCLTLPGLSFAYKHYISPFPGSSSIDIPNSHLVWNDTEKQRKFYRGMAPVTEGAIESLKANKINQILIIKSDSQGEVSKEISQLLEAGYLKDQIHQIPLDWKSTDLYSTCTQFIDALNYLINSDSKKNTYFHCTVGEDRTGVLTGLLKIYNLEKPVSKEKQMEIFNKHLCRWGYAAGNPNKPRDSVVKKLRKNLSPVWIHMSEKLSLINSKVLTHGICKELKEPGFVKTNRSQYTCKPQSVSSSQQRTIEY